MLAQALTAATAITDDSSRAQALAALAPHLPRPAASRAGPGTDRRHRHHRRLPPRPGAGRAGAPPARPDLLAQALTAATAITNDYSRAQALAALAPVPARRPAR